MTLPEITCFTPAGMRFQVSRLLSFECIKSYDTPADSLSFSFVCYDELPEFASVIARSNGITLFDGVMDRQSIKKDRAGLIASFEARSRGALLIDNEALPQTYINITLKELFNRHIKPYGFSAIVAGHDYRLESYTVPKGICEWEVLSVFCRSAAGKGAYISGNQVFVGVPPATRRHKICNAAPDVPKYCSLSLIYDRSGVVSSVSIRDKDGYYSHCEYNLPADNLSVRRHRYLIPAPEWAATPLVNARQRIRESMLGYQRAVAVLPGLVEASVGDRADIDDALMQLRNVYVSEIKLSLSNSGIFTTLELRREEYL